RNLRRAAIAARAQRIVVGSFALIGAAQAVRSMETQVLDASRGGEIESVVLRYGLFYGPGNPATDELIALIRKSRLPRIRKDSGQLPFIHLDDAVAATIAALDHGSPGSVYDIVDDQPTS